MTRYRALAVAWTLLILIGCALPGSELPDVSMLSLDKLIHAALFAGFGWLWMQALAHRPGTRTRWILTAGVLLALLTEAYQGLLPLGRTADPYDVAANLIGLLLAVSLVRLRARRTSEKHAV
ncbi:MAG: VanZ family protein [Bacteroidetes bacterium]|nr:MAG: VanZ family protein [Bacteroidota bacterium]